MRGLLIVLVVVLQALSCAPVSAFHHPPHRHSNSPPRHVNVNVNVNVNINVPSVPTTTTTELHANNNNNNNNNNIKPKNRPKGIYARPSAAIERGSGFFVPGLEGSRVRILFGSIVLVLNYINTSFGGIAGRTAATNNVADAQAAAYSALDLSANVSTFFGVLLLLQGSVEMAKEMGLGIGGGGGGGGVNVRGEERTGAGRSSSSGTDLKQPTDDGNLLAQVVSPSLGAGDRAKVDAVRWVAATYVALTTAASHVMLLECRSATDGAVLYRLGNFDIAEDEFEDEGDVAEGVRAAMETVYGSKGGRVGIPATHPAAVGLLPEGSRRCVLLQRVDVGEDRRLCLLVGSSSLLQAYSKNDLRWLGRLGKYLSLRV